METFRRITTANALTHLPLWTGQEHTKQRCPVQPDGWMQPGSQHNSVFIRLTVTYTQRRWLAICLVQLTCYKPDIHVQQKGKGGELLLRRITSQNGSHACLLINILDSWKKESQKANGSFQSGRGTQLKALALFPFVF